MPNDEWRPAKTIAENDIVAAAVYGSRHTRAFIRAYGESDRNRWRELTVPFRPDPAEGRAILIGNRGGDSRDYVEKRLKVSAELRRHWEIHLHKFGLDAAAIAASNSARQHLTIRAGTLAPERFIDDDRQAGNRFGIQWGTVRAVPVEYHERAAPDWAQSDAMVRQFLQHRFPSAFQVMTSAADQNSDRACIRKSARKRAAQLAAVIYLSFRVLVTFDVIGAELHISQKKAETIAAKARRHGDAYFAGQPCCRSHNPYAKQLTERIPQAVPEFAQCAD